MKDIETAKRDLASMNLRTTPIPGLRNVERYAEWVEWCEDVSIRNASDPWWYVQILESVSVVVCGAVEQLVRNARMRERAKGNDLEP